ncbi:MAG: MFS transporter [Acidimicrobiales bacterium]
MVRLTSGRDFRLIWTAGTVSQLGDWSARLALALLVLERDGSAATVGMIAVLYTIPWLGLGQALTTWSAKFTRRGVMITCDSIRAVCFVLIGFVDMDTVPLLVIVGIAAMADPVFEATKSAFVTEIVSTDDYAEAIQVTHVANQSASLLGYALGGVLVGLMGAETTLVLNGASFLLSAILVSAVRSRGGHESDEVAKPSLRAGLRFLRLDPLSALAFGATLIAATTAMSVESQVAVYGTAVAEFSEGWIGILSAVTPAATLVAVAVLKMDGTDGGLFTRVLVAGGLSAAAASVMFFVGVGGVGAFVAFGLLGVIFVVVTTTNVVVGRRLPDSNRVSIFSILQSGVFLGLSLGAFLGGVLSEATSPEVAAGSAMAVCAVGLLLVVPFAFDRPRHSEERPRTRWAR